MGWCCDKVDRAYGYLFGINTPLPIPRTQTNQTECECVRHGVWGSTHRSPLFAHLYAVRWPAFARTMFGGGWQARFGWFTCGSSRVRCGFPIIYQAPQKLSQVNSHLRCRFGGRRPPRRSKCRQQPQTTQIFMFGLINIISYGRVGGQADCESFLWPTPLTLAAGA